MEWNSKKSLMLSKVFVILFLIAVVGVVIAAPCLTNWLINYSLSATKENYYFFLSTIISGGILGIYLLVMLYQLLNHFTKGEVFTSRNTQILRKISWCCFVGSGIALLSSFYYLPWLILCIAAGFMGLIVRIVKNMLEQAIIIKEENDYTI